MTRKRAVSKGRRPPEAEPTSVQATRLEMDRRHDELAPAFQKKLAKAHAGSVLEFAVRSVMRVEGVASSVRFEARCDGLAEMLRALTDYAVCLALESIAEGSLWEGEEVREKAEEAVRKEEALAGAITEADRGSAPVREFARVSYRLFQAVAAYHGGSGDLKRLKERAASVAAHTVTLVEQVDGASWGGRLAEILNDELERPLVKGERIRGPLWPSERPAWSGDEFRAYSLSSIEAHVNSFDMTQFAHNSKADVSDLSAESLQAPPDLEREFAKTAKVVGAAHQKQLEACQRLLDKLTGKSLGSYEKHRDLAALVTRFVARIGGVLTISGRYEYSEGVFRTYTNQPVTIRCSSPKTRSFKILTADGAAEYVTSSKRWPELRVESKRFH